MYVVVYHFSLLPACFPAMLAAAAAAAAAALTRPFLSFFLSFYVLCSDTLFISSRSLFLSLCMCDIECIWF